MMRRQDMAIVFGMIMSKDEIMHIEHERKE